MKERKVFSYIEVTQKQLPISCPIKPKSSEHPRVFIPLNAETNPVSYCPYCGKKFVIKD